jgi:hypothetical protein
MSGNVMLLPKSNVPQKKGGNQQELDAEASKNFGNFAILERAGVLEHGLEVASFKNINGYGGQNLGLGVITTVFFVPS